MNLAVRAEQQTILETPCENAHSLAREHVRSKCSRAKENTAHPKLRKPLMMVHKAG
jgi:hypothetical protein